MYGEKPFEGYPIKLKQVMSVKSKIISIKDVKTGDRVSYNGNFVAKKPIKVAIVPFGYADGLPRSLSNRWFFLVNGKEAPILGKITMDMTIVDVSEIENINIGNEVVIIGESGDKRITFGDIANIVGTISYEIMCGISKRVVRCEKC
jgi:alanine racemase